MNELHANNCVELTNTEMCGCLRDEKYNYLEIKIMFNINNTQINSKEIYELKVSNVVVLLI